MRQRRARYSQETLNKKVDRLKGMAPEKFLENKIKVSLAEHLKPSALKSSASVDQTVDWAQGYRMRLNDDADLLDQTIIAPPPGLKGQGKGKGNGKKQNGKGSKSESSSFRERNPKDRDKGKGQPSETKGKGKSSKGSSKGKGKSHKGKAKGQGKSGKGQSDGTKDVRNKKTKKN